MKMLAAYAWLFHATLLLVQLSQASLLKAQRRWVPLRQEDAQPVGQGREAIEAEPGQDPFEECFEVPKSICLAGEGGQSYMVAASPRPSDLVLWYQFDMSLPVDESGHRNHLTDAASMLTPLDVGPGILGRGGSAALDGQKYRMIHATQALETQSVTVAFWLYLREDSTGSWRTIFNKAASSDEVLPALLLWPDERRLRAQASMRSDVKEGAVDSVGLLPLRRWTHVAVAYTGSVLRLYLNGVMDGEAILQDSVTPTGDTRALFIGRDPWRSGTKAYLDDFRWYNRELFPDEVRALLFPSLTGVSADFVHLGCAFCSFDEAVQSCQGHTHLCSLQELFSGGFHAARSMGWLSTSPEVWYDGAGGRDGAGADLSGGVRKLSLCCTD